MRIAVYSGEIPSTTFIENLIAGLAQKHTILLFGTRKKKVRYATQQVRVYPLYKNPILLGLASLYWLLKLALFKKNDFIKLKRHINGQKGSRASKMRLWNKYGPVVFARPDIFHIQWAKGVGEWLFLKQLFNIRLVVSFRGAHMNYSQITDPSLDALYAHALPLYDGYHAVSQDILNNALVYAIDENKARIIPPAVKDEWVLEKPVNTKPIDKKPLQLLSVGRDHWIKGYDVAIDACKILAGQGIDFVYTIVGAKGSEELQFQIAQLGLHNKVVLLGALPHHKVKEFYQLSHLLVLPSHAEGVPNVVLEAMASGLPVLSTLCGGVSSIIDHGVNGWLVPVRNPMALATQINEILNLPNDTLQEVAYSAFNTIRERYVLSRQIDDMEALYEMVLENSESL